jgi:hypothetical protein
LTDLSSLYIKWGGDKLSSAADPLQRLFDAYQVTFGRDSEQCVTVAGQLVPILLETGDLQMAEEMCEIVLNDRYAYYYLYTLGT